MKVNIKDTGNIDRQVFRDGDKCWFVDRLIKLSKQLKVQTMPIQGLNLYGLYPKINTTCEFVDHVKRVLASDLKCPIILDGEGYVMDGRHRIAKALLHGKETIDFVRFEETPYRDYEEGE
jgi:hypothetical protein